MIKKEANLIVTFDPSHSESAKKEISELMNEIKQKFEILDIEDGVAEIMCEDPRKAISKLENKAKRNLHEFHQTNHWIPIDFWTKNSIPDIQKKLKEIEKLIKVREKWKMEIKTRKVKEKPDELKLIIQLAESIDRKNIDLDKPNKIVRVEIIGNKVGLSLLSKKDMLNIPKLKQA
jgi:tRNA(Ser,Leu) C12 N-acetylase TAN1